MIGASPDLSKGSIFYSEKKGFTHLLLHGIEYHILVAYMALFAYIDFTIGSSIKAGAIVWVIDIILVAIRSHFGQINISKKTFFDSKFLI